MNSRRIACVLFVVMLCGVAASGASANTKVIPFQAAPFDVQYVPDRFIVVLTEDAGTFDATDYGALGKSGITSLDLLAGKYAVEYMRPQFIGAAERGITELSRYYKVQFSGPHDLQMVMAAYAADPMVDHVEPIGIHPMYATPNDGYYSYQWYHYQANDHDIDSPEAWDLQTGDDNLIVALLDSGVRYYHPDLGGINGSPSNPGASRGNMWINTAELYGSSGVDDDGNGYTDDWIGYDFIDGVSNCWSGEDCNTKDNDPRDFNGHGTHTAGIITMISNDGYGMAGTAGGWNNGSQTEYGNGVKVMCLRMGYSYNYLGQEYGVVMMDAAAEAFYYAADNGAKIASCSWGSSNSGGIGAAATYFLNSGGIICVAAGNDGAEVSADYLNGRGDCISVAATNESDDGASFTTYGTWVDICAPGDNIYSTYHDHTDPNTNYWASMGGTSMATPMTAAVCGLIWSQNPGWSASQVQNQLYTSADNIDAYLSSKYIGKMGAGRINSYNAVNTGTPPPVANFSGSPTSGCAPLTVNFADLSTGDITSWDWTFGDGGTSTAQNPSHQYTSTGIFTVSLTVTGPGGNDTETKTGYITVNDVPTAGFTGSPTSGEVPLTVDFTNQSSGASSYSWDFGDTQTSTATNPSHTYTSAGTYTVTLTATNSCGSDDEVKVDYITVTCTPPVADFSGSPTSGNAPLTVNFTDLSTGATSWDWDFGDGVGTSTAQNPTYEYTTAGIYTVTLTVTNSCGSDGETKTDYVTVSEFTGYCDDFNDGDMSDWTVVAGDWTASGGQYDGYISSGMAYTLAPVGDIADGTITVDWTSLTGGTWTNGMVVFAWQDANNYRVADCRDGANTWYIREFIGGTQYNRASFAETINTNQMYQLEVIIDPSGLVTVKADGVTKVSYDFGSVTTGQVGLCVNQSHSQFDNFCVDAEQPVPPPVAAFSGTPTSGCAPLTVDFTDASTGDITSWDWDFGDTGTSTAQNPSHQYNNAGTYTVTLIVTGPGGSDGETKTGYITVSEAPTAGFTGSPTSGEVPLTVNFTNQSSGATSYLWDFGDTQTSTATNPSHDYTAAGTYTVTLTATNSCGSDDEVKVDYITVTCTPPVANFSGNPTSGDAPLTVNFTDLSTGATSWDWDFGDGVGTSTAQNPSYEYTSVGTYTVTLTATNSCGSDGETKTDYITVTEAGGYASLPYSTGFEAGALDEYWITVLGAEGRIQVTTANTPHSGSYHLTMDDHTNGGSYSQNEAWLHVNLAGKSDVDLTFWWKEFSDETHTQDGVYFSDNGGSSFTKVYDLTGGSTTWQEIALDVDALSAANGLSLTGTYVIKFQQYDNYGITTDGMAFDDVSVVSSEAPPVADFVGTPTSGNVPLTVSFTDQSSGNPTSWSWDFGDGVGTSSAQNPSYEYTSVGLYTVTLTASNAYGSDVETKTDYIDVTEAGAWTMITSDDFEGGWGSYSDGGGDCSRYTGGTYAHQGSAALDIQDNSGTASSFYHTAGYNVSGYTELEVEFWFYAVSMDNSNEDFWLQYYDGSTWHTVETWARSIDFDNGLFYNEVVTISSSSYNFPANAKLRFMCDASGNRDDVYIDEIEWRGMSGTAAFGGPSGQLVAGAPKAFESFQNYPNPFNAATSISFALPEDAQVTLEVYNVLGQRVRKLVDDYLPAGKHTVHFDARNEHGEDLASGIYFYRLQTDHTVATKKMILLK